MTLAVLVAPGGAPPLPAAAEVVQRIRFGPDMTWTGANGTSFDLKFRSGVCLMPDSIVGLLNPTPEFHTTATPVAGGSRLRGVRYVDRDVFWPLMVHTDAGSRAWQDLNDAFFATLDPERAGVWEVTRFDGSRRRLNVFFKGDGGGITWRQIQSGWTPYPISGVAFDPWWYGEEVHRRFQQPAAAGTLAGPGRPIGSAGTVATATIDNPGDVDSYPRYRVTGPTTSVTVGVTIGGVSRNITVPFTLTGGQYVDIDTASHRVVDHAGVSRRADLSAAYFVPVPPGRAIPLTMSMTGTGTVDVWLPTKYRRGL